MSNDQAKMALDAARHLAAEGKFQDALEKHIWYHDHALEVDQGQYGVRLSFALADWIELGGKYPPALNALLEIRDRKTSRLLAGEAGRELFHDVMSINERFGEHAATVGLFKKIDVMQPQFAEEIYDLADEALITAGEYALAKKYLGDAGRRFEIAKSNFVECLEYSETSQFRDMSRRTAEMIFAGDVVRIVTVLDKTGDFAVAREIQAKALVVLDNPAIRNAIHD